MRRIQKNYLLSDILRKLLELFFNYVCISLGKKKRKIDNAGKSSYPYVLPFALSVCFNMAVRFAKISSILMYIRQDTLRFIYYSPSTKRRRAHCSLFYWTFYPCMSSAGIQGGKKVLIFFNADPSLSFKRQNEPINLEKLLF